MSCDDTPLPPPELTVLEALKETCEAVRRHNSSPEVARAALQWEMKIAVSMDKLNGGADRKVAVPA